jgi:hypothetical protein
MRTGIVLVVLASALSVQCTSATGPMELRRPKEQAATKVTEVKLSPGSECIVKRESGAVVRAVSCR